MCSGTRDEWGVSLEMNPGPPLTPMFPDPTSFLDPTARLIVAQAYYRGNALVIPHSILLFGMVSFALLVPADRDDSQSIPLDRSTLNFAGCPSKCFGCAAPSRELLCHAR